jgi:outer membrane protein assembly factor BamE (lipoprotein component of BamABCDE complex)
MLKRYTTSVCRRMVLLCAGASLLAACGTAQIGRDFDIKSFESRVERGVTTKAQVRDWLGAPTNAGVAVSETGERSDEWTYVFGRGSLPQMSDTLFKYLQIRFDTEGKVRSYSWSGEAATTHSR